METVVRFIILNAVSITRVEGTWDTHEEAERFFTKHNYNGNYKIVAVELEQNPEWTY